MDTSELSRLLLKAKAQKFGKDDSQIVSALMHPVEAINRGGEWFRHNVAQASGGDPYDNANPLIGASQEQQAESGLNLAGLAQLGAMPGAPASAGGTLGTFIGPKASGWDKEKAALAKKLLDEGANPAQVWKDTLHGRLPNSNFPISEIDDGWATINSDKLTSAKKLGDILDHPELYNQYPHLKDIDFEYDPSYTGAGFDAGIDKVILGKGSTDEINKSNLLHEASHVIDKYEGRPEGGMPVDSSPMAMDVYNRLTGEALARSVQAREPMTMGMRRNTYPMAGDKLDDVPIRRLIDRYDNDQMSGSVAANQLPETEFSQAHKLAQEHAALPVEQGGLGLHPDNTAMERARALGFDTETPLYHGRASNDLNDNYFPKARRGASIGDIYSNDSPIVANNYAMSTTPKATKTTISEAKKIPGYSPNVTPLIAKKGFYLDDSYQLSDALETKKVADLLSDYDSSLEFASMWSKRDRNNAVNDFVEKTFIPEHTGSSLPDGLKGLLGFVEDHPEYRQELLDGFDGVKFEDLEAGGNTLIPFENKNIRSRFAAFDPFNKDSANILASALLGTTLASQMKDKDGN